MRQFSESGDPMIIHLIKQTEWEASTNLEAIASSSLKHEGFIHCCNLEQLENIAECYYKGQSDLLILVIDERKLSSELKYEAAPGYTELYPHLYGPINREALAEVIPLPCGLDGTFKVPDKLRQIQYLLSGELDYRDLAIDEVNLIHGLWEMNRSYHENISENFSHIYTDLNFEDRMAFFSKIDPKHVKLTMVYAGLQPIAYCLSYIEDGRGECASLHVDRAYRGKKVGKALVSLHLDWFDTMNCAEVEVTVACDNLNTVAFYESLGFKANTLSMYRK